MATSAGELKQSLSSRSQKQFYEGGPFVLSSDGLFIACACGDSINIVDSSDSSLKSTFKGESHELTALALTPDDKLLFSSGLSRQIRVWDLATLKCILTWEVLKSPVMGIACHASGKSVATAGANGNVLVWAVASGNRTHGFEGHEEHVSNILFHPDANKNILFSGSIDRTVRVWDLMAKTCLAIFDHNSSVTSFAVSKDGLTLLSSGKDKVVNVWDLSDYSHKARVEVHEVVASVTTVSPGTPLAKFIDSLPHTLKKKKTSAKGTHFITVGKDGIVRIWNSKRSLCLYRQKFSDLNIDSVDEQSERGFTAAALLPCHSQLLCVTSDYQFFVYSIPKRGGESELVLKNRLVGYNEIIADIKFLGDKDQFLAVAAQLDEVRVYDVATMLCSYVLAGHKKVVMCLDTCISSSGNILVVTGSLDKTVRLWNTARKTCIGIGRGHTDAILAVAFAKKSSSFFVSVSDDCTMKMWNLDGILENPEEPFAMSSRTVATTHMRGINCVAVSPNDSLICTGSKDRKAIVWKLPDYKHVCTLGGHTEQVYSVEFSPVERWVMTSSQVIQIWDISDGSCLKTFSGHPSSVLRASFITDGAQLVSTCAGGFLKLWNVMTNECVATYDKHKGEVESLAVGTSTDVIATGGDDAAINIWRDSTETLLEADDVSTILDVVQQANKSKRRKIGANEVIKTIRRGNCEFVVLAANVKPLSILFPLQILAKEQSIPCVYVPTKAELGRSCGLKCSVIACAITSPSLQEETGCVLTSLIRDVKVRIEKLSP